MSNYRNRIRGLLETDDPAPTGFSLLDSPAPRTGLLGDPLPRRLEFAPDRPRPPAVYMPMPSPWSSGNPTNTIDQPLDARAPAPTTLPDIQEIPIQGVKSRERIYDGPPETVPNEHEIMRRAAVIFGETSGVLPKLKDPNGSPYDPNNWDPASTKQLELARTLIGVVAGRNPITRSATPTDPSNKIEARAWADAVEAARNISGTKFDDRANRFFLRQRDSEQRVPAYSTLIPPIGPFHNVGSGDVPKGSNTFIDFYTDRK